MFLLFQVVANIFFKWGSTAPQHYWWGFALGNAVGTVRVKVTKLHIRTQPATTADLVGDAREGATYTYYAAEEGEGYTWYRIGKDQWIADQGEWLEITKFAE